MFWKARPTTVYAAIAPLLQAQSDLESVVNERSDLINKNHITIADLQADNLISDAERIRAGRIGTALKAITDPKTSVEVTKTIDD